VTEPSEEKEKYRGVEGSSGEGYEVASDGKTLLSVDGLRPGTRLFTTDRKGFTLSPQPPNNDEIQLRREVLLTAQVALLGEVSAAVRAVALAWSPQKIHLRAVFDGEIDDEDSESMECVGTEILASFSTHEIEVECTRLDAPSPLKPLFLMAWVYMRKES
jgi:hypothetical protein